MTSRTLIAELKSRGFKRYRSKHDQPRTYRKADLLISIDVFGVKGACGAGWTNMGKLWLCHVDDVLAWVDKEEKYLAKRGL